MDYFGDTVVYSKARNGRQVRLTGTSPIARRDPKSLSGFFDIAPRAARCALEDGVATLIESGRPALPDRE